MLENNFLRSIEKNIYLYYTNNKCAHSSKG